MLLTTLPALHAPQPTGHPAALPSVAHSAQAATRVQAPAKGQDAAGAHIHNGQTGRGAEHTPKKDTQKDTAPPTILQIKINTMLQEQAEKLKSTRAEESTDEPGTTEGAEVTQQEPDKVAAQPHDTRSDEVAAPTETYAETAALTAPDQQAVTEATNPPEDAPEALS